MHISELNELTFNLRGAIFTVHKELGPGLLESIYESALIQELSLLHLTCSRQMAISVYYKGIKQEIGFRLDLLVENEIIVEVKSIERIMDIHRKQLLTYLKLTNKRLGYLVNFNVSFLVDKESLIRMIN